MTAGAKQFAEKLEKQILISANTSFETMKLLRFPQTGGRMLLRTESRRDMPYIARIGNLNLQHPECR
jgi:hypothetical protein